MKYEEIKIGDVFTYNIDREIVIYKDDKCRIIVTIDDGIVSSTWPEKDLHFLKPLKEELPEEGLLVSEVGSLVYKLSDGSGYGFVRGNQSDYYFNKKWSFVSTPESWRKATKQEENKFVEMLEKECEKHGLFEGTRIEASANGNLLRDPDWMGGTPRFDLTSGYNRNGKIFHKGKFATPRKEETTLELVANAVKEIGDFTVEQTKSGVIVLTPIKN